MTRIASCVVGLMVLSLSLFAHAEEPDAEKTLKSFGEFMVGGVWKHEIENGMETVIQFSWFGKNKFIRASTTMDGKPSDSMLILEIDPKTKHVSSWHFSAGRFVKGTMTQQEKGVWSLKVPVNGGGNENILTVKWVRVGQDELSFEIFIVADDGAEQSVFPVPLVWKRHKA